MLKTYISFVRAYISETGEDDSYRERTLELLHATAHPFSRKQYAPGHITVSAVVFNPAASSVVIIWHHRLQRWLQPGGHVEDHEGPFVAAARETEEETGIPQSYLHAVGDGLIDIDIHRIPESQREPSHEHFDLRVAFVSEANLLKPGTDAADACWHSLSSEEPKRRLDASTDRAISRGRIAYHRTRL